MFRASVIIPSHQRAGLLPRTLKSLANQDLPSYLFEVIVVADSCSDGTEQVVQNFAAHMPYRLRVVSHNRKNAAATRNLGARNATGETLIFLDDDIEAAPHLIRRHLAAQNHPRVVSVGYVKLAVPAAPSQWHLEARLWWEDRYREMRQPGYRFGYRDIFSGNCAVPAALFRESGGFAEEFLRLEDYEFGFRLLQAGASLVYTPDAEALHHDSTDLFKWMRRIRDEGAADIQLGNRHMVLRRRLFGLYPLKGLPGYGQKLAFLLDGHGDLMVTTGLRVALMFEKMKLRRRRNSIVLALKFLNYWRGVATAIQSIPALIEWVEEGSNASIMAADAPSLDLCCVREGQELNDILAAGSRKGLRVLIQGTELLQIAAEPWSAPLTLENVESAIRLRCEQGIVPALVPNLAATQGAPGSSGDVQERLPA